MSRRRAKRNSALSILILEVGSLLGIVSIAQPNATRDLIQRAFRSLQPPASVEAAVAGSSLPASSTGFATSTEVSQKPWWSYRLSETERQSPQTADIPELGNPELSNPVPGSVSASNGSGGVRQPSTELNLVDQAAYLSAQRLQPASADGIGIRSPVTAPQNQLDRFSMNSNFPTTTVDSGWRSSVPITAPNYYY